MKRTALLSLVAGLTFLCTNSAFTQTAGFTFVYGNGGCAPDLTTFTNTSTGAHTYRWDFGDFSPPDFTTNPTHNYVFDGTFIVQLTAFDTLTGDSNITTQILPIKFTPFPGYAFFFANPNPVCPGDETNFGSFLFPSAEFTIWDFDDGDSSMSTQPSHAYADTGSYLVVFIAGNSCGADTAIGPPVVVDTSAAIFASCSAAPNPVCPNQTVTFTNFSFPDPVSQIWVFGDGDSATTVDAFHSYADTGTYTVTLIVFSSCNSDTITQLVVVDSSLVPAVSISASPSPVCPGDDVNFSGFGANLQSYLWDFGDSSISLQQDPVHSFADTGTYTVTFIGTNYCGNPDTATTIIIVGDSIAPSFVSFWTDPSSACATFSNICPGSSVVFNNSTSSTADFYWDFDDGDTSILAEPSHAFPDTGTYNVTLVATSSCNGVDSVTNCVYVVDDVTPSAFFCTNPFCFPFTGPICPGTPVFFTNSSSDTAMSFWDFGDGDTSNLAEPIHVFTDTGSFIVLLQVTNGCGKTAFYAETIVVSYNAAPANHDIGAFPSIACPGEVVNFNLFIPPFFFPIDSANVLWDFGDGNTSTVTNPNYGYDSSGTFNVTVIVFTACGNDTASTTVTIKPGSSPDFSYTSVCLGDSVQFTDASTGSPESYSWDFGDGDTSTVQNPLHEFDSAGVTYLVSLTVVDSGCVSNITKPVTVGATLLTMSSVDANCGLSDGQALVSVAGGTPPYTYLWNDPGAQTNATATGLATGTYEVIVEDVIGCLDTANVILGDVPGGIALIFGSNNVTCFSVCDGDATATVAGGTAPYVYGWNDPGTQTTVTATGLCAGTFDVVITDVLGCIDTATVVITQPAMLVASISGSTNISCNGICDGTASVSVVGGIGPYTYLWDDPFPQTTTTAIGLCAGAINVTVTDNNGCTSVVGTIITEPLVLALIMDSIDASCSNADGSAIVAVSGGTAPYTYLWDDPGMQTTDSASGLIAGIYEVVVEDINGCQDSGTVVVNDIAGPSASISGITAVSCFAGNDGSATGSGAGGTAPYTYAWDDPGAQTTATATGLVAGSYQVIITDNIGCQDSAAVVITQPPLLTLTSDSIDATCFGVCDGAAIALAAGGVPPYAYLWDDPLSQITDTAVGLCSGIYNATITDNNGCQAFISVNIDQPLLLASPITASNNISCNGLCDGDATATATGGSPPYSYLWDDPAAQTTAMAVGLCAGTYTVNVTDSNGCTSLDTVVITEPAALSAGILSNTNASCNAACDAVATGSATGGTGIYAYLWDDPGAQISLTATGLCAGSFSFAVVDVNGCSDTAIVVISEPTALLASISDSNNVSCNGICDGDVTGSASGGTAPYSFLWNDPSAQTNAMALGLCAGPYTVNVTDGNGCVDSVGVVISEPSTLTSSITDSTNNSCSASCDGMATVTPVGGTAPYFYNWDAPGGQTDSTSIGLCAGTWTVGIMDANGCLDTVSVIISEPSLIVPTMSSIDATCGISNGQVSVLAAGGVGPYIYLWDDPGAQTNDTATGLAAGGYSVDVTDATGCVVTGIVTVNNIGAATVTISSITNVSCDGGSDGSATLSAIGGTPPYTYSWDDPAAQGNVTATALVAGIYIGTVTDSLGCIGSAIATITEPAPLNLVISSNDVSCFGACDGSASVAANGGTTPYNYLWSPSGCSDSSCVNLCAGVHTVTLTDANGCTATDSAIISEPIALSATVSSTAISCAGSCDGTATGAATGGTAPYTHMWTDSLGDTIALGSTVTGLCAGNYNLILIDDNGCVSSTAFSLLDPIAISLTLSSTQANCGASDGLASVAVTNGAAPFTFLWDDPAVQTNDTASAIAAGTYNVTVTDANGCTALGSTPVGNSGAPLVSVSATDVACNGTCDGTATLSATGGTLPFTYLWDDPGAQTDTTATGLCAGIYTVMLTDGNGCVAFASDTITESAALTLSGSSINPSCNGLCDGAATVTVTGGTAPYTYAWNDPAVQNTLTATGLCNGTFTVVVVDANGCMDSLSLGITAPTAIGISTSAIDVSSCGSCDGSISSVVSGGTAPYAYTWDDPTIQTTDTAFALCSGIYNLTIVDLNGCSASTSDSVNSPGGLLAIISSSNNISCTGACDGSATITASGGTAPYAYLWNDPSAQTNDAALGLCASTVNCLITDATGCTTTISVTLTEPGSPIGVATSTTAASCAGICDGTANATVTGGLTPYVYLWDDPGAQTTATAAGLCGGAVSVVVTDVNGCTISVSDSVGEGSSLTLVMTGDTLQLLGIDDGVTSVNVTGGSGPYTYLWNDPGAQTDSVATGLSVGTYSVTVTDANGCTASGSAQVEIFDRIGELDLGLSFEVYPNPTNGVVTLAIEFSRHMDFNVQVRNLVGEILLVSSYSGNSSLREDLNLGELPNGVYFISVYTEKGSLNRRIVVSR